MTEGRISKSILRFLIPILISSVIQQCYNVVDLIIIGRYSGAEATAAVGASALIVTCMIGFFNGMAIGTNVVAAHAYGKEDTKALKHIAQTAWVAGVIGGFAVMLIGLAFSASFLRWMNTPDDIWEMAVSYLRIYMFSMPAIILYNLAAGILRATGDSKHPMIFQTIGGVLNVIGDIVFVIFLGKGVEGAAFASFLSQSIAAVLTLLYMRYRAKEVRLNFAFTGFRFLFLKKIMLFGIPSGIQAMIITFSNIMLQSQINQFSIHAIAAFTNYFRIEMAIYLPILALGQSVISFVGQNYGARQFERIKQGMRFSFLWGMGMTIMLSVLLLLNAASVMSLFTNNREVIFYGCQIMKITFPFYFLYVIFECLNCELRGKGMANLPMMITVFSFCIVRISALYILLQHWHDVRGVAIIYPVSWSAAVILLLITKAIISRKERLSGIPIDKG